MHERTVAARGVEMGNAESGKPKELLKHRGGRVLNPVGHLVWRHSVWIRVFLDDLTLARKSAII